MSKGYSSLYPKLYVIFVMIFQHEFVQTMAWQHEVETNTKAIHCWNKYVNLYVVNQSYQYHSARDLTWIDNMNFLL